MVKLKAVLLSVLNAEKVEELMNNYEVLKTQSLYHLGIDSLSFLGLIVAIEEQTNQAIDLVNFDIHDIETLEKLNNFLLGRS